MNKLKVKATFIGMNGQAGYLTGEDYFLELSRDSKTGMLIVEREPEKNDHEVSSETPFIMETDEEFYENFETNGEIDFDKITEESKPTARKTAKKKGK